jgi:hypothetical protein
MYPVRNYAHKRVLPDPGTAGKPQNFKTRTAGKGTGAYVAQGGRQVHYPYASAIKKSPVFYAP